MCARTAVVAPVLLAILACATPRPETVPVPAQPGDRVVFRGIVQDVENYARLSNATVELALVGQTNQPIAVAVTDPHGNFVFSGLSAGTYVLHIGLQGYNEVRMRIQASSSEQKPLDVRLRSLRARCVPSRYHTADCP